MTDIQGFFSGSGRKTVKFPVDKPGTTFTGVITAVHPPEEQTDFETRAPIPGKYQMRIDLDTDELDPQDPDDDGKYTLYVKGWLQGAIGDALKAAGAVEPQVGAKLAVTYTGSGTPTRPGLNGPKKYSAVYTPGTAGAAGFYANGQAAPAAEPSGPTLVAIPTDPACGDRCQGVGRHAARREAGHCQRRGRSAIVLSTAPRVK